MFVPDYYPKLVELVRSANWLVHNFPGKNVDIYRAIDYQHNRLMDDIKYQVVLDMNCLQYLLDMVKKPQSSKLSRTAAAYLAFFQIADIQLDPTYAIYEKINYTDERADEAISNLEQFRGIDNHSLDELAAYALGNQQQLCIEPIAFENREGLKGELLKYRRLTEWDSLYLFVLAVTAIEIDSSISRPKKLLAFVNWCISEFRFSPVALVYAGALFGRSPAKRMMKYKAKESHSQKQASLSNMTWDLYYIDRYMKSWASKDAYIESLMLTADAGLKLTMQLAVECQLAEGFEPLRPHLGHELHAVETAYSNRDSKPRAFMSEGWSPEYRSMLITRYESTLL